MQDNSGFPPAGPPPEAEQVLPVLEERFRIGRRGRETGRVRVAVTTAEQARTVEEVLRRRVVEVTRVPVGRVVAAPPELREEGGDTLVVPVVEEVLVVERRLVLREEVRLRLGTEHRREAHRVVLRCQDVAVTRLPPAEPAPATETHSQEGQPPMADHHGTHTLTGLFDTRPDAERAVEYLVQHLGLDRSAVHVHAAGAENVTAGTHGRRAEGHVATPEGGATAARHAEDHGFLASLRDLFMPEDDRETYAEGIRRGGIMVSAEVPDARMDEAVRAFEENNAVDLEERERSWGEGWRRGGAGASGSDVREATRHFAAAGADRAGRGPQAGQAGTGWEGTATGAALGLAADGSRTGVAGETGPVVGGQTSGGAARTVGGPSVEAAPAFPNPGSATVNPRESAGSGTAGTMHAMGGGSSGGTTSATPGRAAGAEAATQGGRRAAGTEEERIPLVEEQLRVGKRVHQEGRVRVRTYVREVPVQEQVRLHEEHVQVERRPVDRPLTGADAADAFRDRTIEATESAEEAVLSKEARVREEVVVRKTAEDRQQTVSDKLRRTEVEVEDERRKQGGSGATRDPGR